VFVTRGRRWAALFLLVAALVLAALGQIYFFYRRDYLWDGVVLYGLALLCFVLAWRLSHPRPPARDGPQPSRLGAWTTANPIPAGLLALGLFLSFTATVLSQERGWNDPTSDVVLLWMLGLGATVAAALWPASWTPRPWQRWKLRLKEMAGETWLEVAVVLGLTALAFLLRVAALDRVPYTLGGDEAWHGLLARSVLSRELRNPFVMGYLSMPTAFYWPLSWSLWLVGDTMVGLRMPAVLVGTATVPILYLFARDLWGQRTALLAATFLATYDYHIHYSRLGANNVWDAMFVVLALWLLDQGLVQWNNGAGGEPVQERPPVQPEGSPRQTRKRHRYIILAGLVMGLSAYFYTGARLLPLLVAGYLVYLLALRCLPRISATAGARPSWHLVVLLILALLVAAGPMLSYALSHPNDWNARLNQVGIIQSGWLEREPELTGKSTLQILAEQFLRAAGAFHVFPDRTVWYGADRPLLGFLPGIFALLGMGWAIANWKERRYSLVLLWFWAVIITGGMLTESPPSSQRLVIAIPAVALLVAFGVEQLVRLIWRLLDLSSKWRNVTMGMLVVVMALSNLHFYFVEFTPSRRYGSAIGETATMIGQYLHDLDDDYQVYFFGAPLLYWNFGTMPFLSPDVPAQDVVESLDALPDFVDTAAAKAAGRDILFIFLPERAGELDWVRQAFPAGRLREFRDAGGELRFIAYRVSSRPGE
jgi:4-amino-4-deoxy-L-arabinose transferase-like glycosyltransferase